MTLTTNTKLKKKLISQAIEVLRETKKHNEESIKKALFEDDSSTIFLQVLLKKIPKRNTTQMIKVNLPHSLLKDSDEVCLIAGDTNKNDRKAETEPDVLLYRALLDKHGVTQVSKIVTLRQLRTDYKPYADKQKLLAAYDVFIADNKIYECLPRVLGKFFYKKRKFPHKINMKSSNLKQQIEKALSIKMFYVTGNGNSCCSEVATLDMSNSEIRENVVEMINTVSKEVPGAWDNIMGIYLKTARSQSIPVYVSYGNPNDVLLPVEDESDDDVIMDELTTKPNVSVKVHNDGRVELFTPKRIQEVCSDEISKGDVEGEKTDSQEKKKRKKFELKGDSNATKRTKHDDSTKKSKKDKKNVFEDSDETPLMTEELPEKKKKSASKRKRDLNESVPKEKELFISFESPKQDIKKRKVDSENLKKQQLLKNARKKILQRKTKKNFKA